MNRKLLGDNHPQTHIMRGSVIWDLPKLKDQTGGMRALAYLVNDWSLASIWRGATGAPYSIGYTYTSNGNNIDITGSPDFSGRVVITGDPGSGCSKDPLKQFNSAAFKGPTANSVGLESGSGYLKGCFFAGQPQNFGEILCRWGLVGAMVNPKESGRDRQGGPRFWSI